MSGEDIAGQRRRCNWCGRFVPSWMPMFTWHRTIGDHDFVGDDWVQVGPAYGWTDPQTLCPDHAEDAASWSVHDVFAEVAHAHPEFTELVYGL